MGRALYGPSSPHDSSCLCVNCFRPSPNTGTDPPVASTVVPQDTPNTLIGIEPSLPQTSPQSQPPSGAIIPSSGTSGQSGTGSATTFSYTPLVQSISDSTASLRRAAQAIEEAYQRLLDIRNHIRQNNIASMPANVNNAALPSTGDTMGPSHSAIVLSNEVNVPPSSRIISPWISRDQVLSDDEDPPTYNSSVSSGRTRTYHSHRLEGTRSSSASVLPVAGVGAQSSSPGARVENYRLRPTRRAMVGSYLLHRRDSNPSDASTTLGRRVAARAAANGSANESTSGGTDVSSTHIMEMASNIDSAISRLNDHREQLIAASGNLRGARHSSSNVNPAGTSSSAQLRRPRPLPNVFQGNSTSLLASSHVPRPELVRSAYQSERDGLLRTISRSPPSSQPFTRLRREETSRIVIDSRTGPTIQPQSTSNSNPPGLMPLGSLSNRSSATLIPAPNDGSSRDQNYRVLRHYTSEGIERVHSLTLSDSSDSDDDDPYSWLMSSRALDEQQSSATQSGEQQTSMSRITADYLEMRRLAESIRRANSRSAAQRLLQRGSLTTSGTTPLLGPTVTTSSRGDAVDRGVRARNSNGMASPSELASRAFESSMARRRRRGWARLDQDGNEIPTDEEEEYERNRSYMRVRAQALTAQFNNDGTTSSAPIIPRSPPPPSQLRLSSMFTPTTQTHSPSPSDDLGYVRVRINPLLRSRNRGNDNEREVGAGLAQLDAVAIETFGSPVPFSASPLPLPLVQLNLSSPSTVPQKRVAESRAPVKMVRASPASRFAGR